MNRYEVVIIETVVVRKVYQIEAENKETATDGAMFGLGTFIEEEHIDTIDTVVDTVALIPEAANAPTT